VYDQMGKCGNAQVNGFIKMTVKITRIIDVSQLQLSREITLLDLPKCLAIAF